MSDYSFRSPAAVAAHFDTGLRTGLSPDDVQKRKKRYGPNALRKTGGFRFARILFRQIASPLVIILLIAGAAAFFLEAFVDTIVIGIALLINVVVGVFQEGRASRAFERLKESQEQFAVVVRGGRKMEIPSAELVPGDIVELEPGRAVPADGRLIFAHGLRVNESALTGEWVDVEKNAHGNVPPEAPITDQITMVWMGTLVSSGDARAVVTATGSATELGAIAESLQTIEQARTPLQRNVRKLARFLAAAVGVAIVAIAVIGIARGEQIGEMLLVAVAVAVAAVPSGLPAAVTVVLALGMERILALGGLVRNLLAAETLGSTTIILTDKTGTLTEAKMRVARVASCSACINNGDTAADSWIPHADDERQVLEYAVAASDAFVEWHRDGKEEDDAQDEHQEENGFVVRGRPVEKAIVLAGLESGMSQDELLERMPRRDFLQFESDRKFAASLHESGDKKQNRLIVVGAPELLLAHATHFLENGARAAMHRAAREKLNAFQERTSETGARLVAVAYRDHADDTIPAGMRAHGVPEHAYTFAGFIVLEDPVREGAREAVQTARAAGMRVAMLTGDHAATALSVARATSIAAEDERPITGQDINDLSDAALQDLLERNHVFARVLPQQKLRIARLLKKDNEVVAMTGDGVNDAPALQNADIGIALGSGTEVAKESSDLVLLNNSFAIIVETIREGRKIVDNLKKIVAYLLSTGFSEIFVVGGALLFAGPLPLLPAQILWINIIEEGFMNFAFAFEPAEKGIMKRRPRSVARGILTPALKKLIALIAVTTGVLLVAVYLFLLSRGIPIEKIRTIMFIALSVDSIFFSFSLKNLHRPVWHINPFSNRYLVVALALSIAILLAALVFAPLRTLLSLEPLSPVLVAAILGFGVMNLVIIETAKYFIFEKNHDK